MSTDLDPSKPTLAARLFGPWVRELDRATLRADLLAGLLGAVLVLPQAIAFATLAGLPPQMGLATAVLPCALAALFGSSRHLMSGPSNAISLALAATLAPLALAGSPEYIELAIAVTLLVGLLQTLIGVFGLGSIANFISPAALMGFTTGAALLIVVHALPDLLGLPAHGASALLAALPGFRWGPLAVAAATLVGVLATRRWRPRWPSMLIGLALGTLCATALRLWQPALGEAIARVGPVPPPWPIWHWPQLDAARLRDLAGIVLALTLVASAQSIAMAKTVALRSGQRIDVNRELFGQGLSNLVGGVTSAYLSGGSVNRSLPNYEAGARTPMASVFSALLLLLLTIVSAPLLAAIPLAAISALLVLVAISLLDLERWQRLARIERADFITAAVTAIATLSLRLEIAILLGSLLSLGSHLHRTSRPAMRTMGFDSDDAKRPFVVLDEAPAGALPECPQLKLLRMEGAVYFAAVPHVGDTLQALREGSSPQLHLLVMAKSMNTIDLPAAEMWAQELAARRAAGGDLYFHRPRPPVMQLWRSTGFLDALGADHVFADKHSAIAAIVPRLDDATCAACTRRIFAECAGRPRNPTQGGELEA
ncbi:SulP family inorganic anion transporter [Rivibacter subsaxonicus]|uniref:SulP family sulfate permease n=1 Tax=Rivibacter subsaxonicus TaxID=457575 RepID=A0A4Q7VVA2_9BURK|nr:SulP family inorganic anion transporter [Rivibacter subsaxonicus]RZU00503.1 SulP family sulfate permease [Rivibacter subsaxonicus]